MEALTMIILALCVITMVVQGRRHKAEKRKSRQEMRECELQLKAYHRAAMHNLNWEQTKQLVDMAFFYSRNSEQERLKLEAAADTAVLTAFHEWCERSANIS